MTELADRELIRDAKAGKREAFGVLVERNMKGIYSLAYSFVQNHTEADDLSQEVFLSAYRNLAAFKEKSSFRTWLYRIAINLCTNYIKRKPSGTKLSHISSFEDSVILNAEAKSETPPKKLQAEELQKRIYSLLKELPLEMRNTMHLVVEQGLSHEEAAQMLGCSRNTVSWRIFHCRELLRKKLGSLLED